MLIYANSKRLKHTLTLDLLFDLEKLEERKIVNLRQYETGS